MKFSLALLAVFLPVIVNAQSDAGDVNVIVPDGALAYDPSNFTVSNGTDVNFLSAWSHAHSACTFLAGSNGSLGGVDSVILAATEWTITITNDQESINFVCKSSSSLQYGGRGMAGAINAPATRPNSPDVFLSAAMDIGTDEVPETDNGPVTGGVKLATAPPTHTSTSSPSASPSSTKSSDVRRLFASGIFAFLASALNITIS